MKKISPISFKGVPYNYGDVCSYISRSAKPDQYDFSWLKQQGVTDVVDFSTEYEDLNFWFNEKKIVEDLGMKYHKIPFTPEEPNEGVVEKFLSLVKKVKNEGGKVHMHCLMGADRTGFMAFIYKMSNNIDNAFDNMHEWIKKGHNPKRYPKLIPWAQNYLNAHIKYPPVPW